MKYTYVSLMLLAVLLTQCTSDDTTDSQKPVIDLSYAGTFPNQCDTIYFDTPFVVRYYVTDNVALGNISLDIHHNFDHHSHSTEVEACSLAEAKQAVNPYIFIHDYPLPANQTGYIFEQTLTIPQQTSKGLADEGDYHLLIQVTDQTGWSTPKGLGIKLLAKP